jgi:RNA polymerase sigma-70 factor (ECF subfamily)
MERDRFEQLYAEHAQPLYGFLAYRTGNPALAEDLLGETFERVLRARRSYDSRRASEKTWIYSIALNLLRDHARRRDAELRALQRGGAPDGAAEDPFASLEARDAVGRALANLSPEEREAVSLRFGGDLSVPEVARVLGEPLDRVEGRVYRALRKMRAELGAELAQD